MQLLRKKGLLDSPRVLFLPVDAISPNPNQPRRVFGTQELEELAGSIQALGLLQPLTVRRRADGWELVAGERRLRAAKLAGLEEVPCISLQIDDQRSSLLALVENLQRKDLDFWEEAKALRRLIDTYSLSQEEVARRIGKSQSAVANKLRILRHPPSVLQALRESHLTERHARALLRLTREEDQIEAVQQIRARLLSVKDTDQLIDQMLTRDREERHARRPRRVTRAVRDYRLFVNTLKAAFSELRTAGVEADLYFGIVAIITRSKNAVIRMKNSKTRHSVLRRLIGSIQALSLMLT